MILDVRVVVCVCVCVHVCVSLCRCLALSLSRSLFIVRVLFLPLSLSLLSHTHNLLSLCMLMQMLTVTHTDSKVLEYEGRGCSVTASAGDFAVELAFVFSSGYPTEACKITIPPTIIITVLQCETLPSTHSPLRLYSAAKLSYLRIC